MAVDSQLGVRVYGIDDLSAELKKIESGVIRFVGAISSALTALAAVGFPIIESAQFQKELLNAAKTTDYTTEQTTQLKQGLVDLSAQIDVTAVDLAKIATMGGQLGIGVGDPASLVAFTEEVARAVTALDIPAEEAVASFGKLINIFNIPPNKFKNAISSLNEVSNASNATASELFDVVRRIGNLGGSVTLPEAAALSASMIDLGLTAETAGTTVTKIFADMKSKAADFAAFIGDNKVFTGGMQGWIDLVNKDGLKALDVFIDKLNSVPAATAAAAKVDLTGGGRIFEAVTKIQEQRARAVKLTQQAQALENQLSERGKDISEEELRITQERVIALRQQAEQVNIISRLTSKANQGFTSGDSAQREQQTVLSGLSRQWVVFTNNITKTAMAVGDVLLPPLTELLRNLSASISTDATIESLKSATRDIVETVRKVYDVISRLKSGLQGSEMDWGSLLRLGALLAGLAAIKGAMGLLSGLFNSLGTSLPVFGYLSKAIFGVAAAADAAKTKTSNVAQDVGRTGGLFNTLAQGFQKAGTNLVGIEQASQKVAVVQNRLATATGALAARQAILDDARQKSAANLMQIASLEVGIAAASTRAASQQEAGEKRSAAAYRGRVTVLTKAKDAAIAEGVAIAGALSIAEAKAAASQGAVDRAATSITKYQTAILNLSTGFTGVILAAGRAAAAIRLAFQAGLQAGSTGGASAALVAMFSSMWSSINGPALTAALAGASAKLKSFAIATAASVSEAFKKGMASSPFIDVGVVRGSMDAIKSVFSSVASAISGNAGSGAFSPFIASAKLAALEFVGIGDEWTKATSRMAKGTLLVAGAINLLGKVVSGAMKILRAFANISLFAIMAKDLLEFLGLWQGFVKYIEKVWKFFGGNPASLPSFLQSKETIEKSAIAYAKVEESAKGATRQAAAFNDTMKSTLITMANKDIAKDALTFDMGDPEKASRNTKETLAAIGAAYDKRKQLAEDTLSLEKEQGAALKEVLTTQDRLSRKKPEDLFYNAAKRNADNAEADLARINNRLVALSSQAKDLTPVRDALRNLTQSIFSQEEGLAILGTEREGDISLLEKWAVSIKEAADAQQQAEIVRQRSPAATSGDNTQSAAAIREQEETLRSLADRQKEAEKTTASFEAEMLKAARSPTEMKKNLDTLRASVDKTNLKDIAIQMSNIFSQSSQAFTGASIPTIGEGDLLKTGADIAVREKLRSMYATLGTMAKVEAERAKNALTTALSDVQKMAKQTEEFILRITRSVDAAKAKASRQVADRADDATSRQNTLNIQTQYDIEKAFMERNFSLQQAGMDELQAGGMNVAQQKYEMYAMEKQSLFEIDERYKVLFQKEEDRLNLQKARRGVADEVKEFDKLIAKVDVLKKKTEAANAVLADPTATTAQKASALDKREDSINKLRASYSQLESMAEKLAATDPIGGELVVDPSQIDKMKTAVEGVSKVIGEVNVQSADKLEGVWKSIESSYSAAEQVLGSQVDQLRKRFDTLAEGISQSSGKPFAEIRNEVALILGASEKLPEVFNKIKEMTTSGIINPGAFDVTAIQEFARKATESLSELKGAEIPVSMTVDQGAISTQVAAAIGEGVSRAGADRNVSVNVNAKFTDETLVNMNEAIQARVKPEIQVTAKIMKVIKADGTILQNDMVYLTEPKARGGLIGSVASLATSIVKFAGGGDVSRAVGRVSGPGTGTSDSILSWLSNGEYVMDALTTSRFGPRFFKLLQDMARGGKATTFLSKLIIPKLAIGGPVNGSMDFSAIANDFKSIPAERSVRDVVDINLTSGGHRVTIQAEREQARAFVGILRQFEKG